MDTYAEPDGQNVVVAAAPVPQGTTLQGWTYIIERSAPACLEKRSFRRGRLGGKPALIAPGSCTDGYDYIQAAALQGRRGYLLMVSTHTIDDETHADTALFNTALRSFRFASR